jgi:hypothetical protein
MKKKIIILILIVLLVLGAIYLYKTISSNDINVDNQVLSVDDVKVVELGEQKNGEELYHGVLFTSYNQYKTFMENYNTELVLKSSDFAKNDFVLDFQPYGECTDEEYKKLVEIKIENSILNLAYDVYNTCGECDSKNIAYFIPVKKGVMKELLPINAVYNNKYPENNC